MPDSVGQCQTETVQPHNRRGALGATLSPVLPPRQGYILFMISRAGLLPTLHPSLLPSPLAPSFPSALAPSFPSALTPSFPSPLAPSLFPSLSPFIPTSLLPFLQLSFSPTLPSFSFADSLLLFSVSFSRSICQSLSVSLPQSPVPFARI